MWPEQVSSLMANSSVVLFTRQHWGVIRTFSSVTISVVDLNTLNLDPDPEFWFFILIWIQGYVINFEKKKKKKKIKFKFV